MISLLQRLAETICLWLTVRTKDARVVYKGDFIMQWGPARVFVGRASTGLIQYGFGPTSRPFDQAHELRVSPDGDRIAVGDISKPTLFMFITYDFLYIRFQLRS
ncbi:unnamed protein product [Cylicocyclus nassatus]|uniref:Uncharacterized protein n=1 Tax=Cylicocyclus nassatus TaxID=53992 RepID=A0AA36GKF3_CYLNA|nr:unnamed protein product [Cylicocyclus nassatus]